MMIRVGQKIKKLMMLETMIKRCMMRTMMRMMKMMMTGDRMASFVPGFDPATKVGAL